MQVVRLVIALLLPIPALAQIPEGEYAASVPGSETSYNVTFYKGRFTENAFPHLDAIEISRGYYWVVGDTLFQYYERTTDDTGCRIEEKTRRLDALGNPTSDTHILIEIENAAVDPVALNVLLRSGDNRVLKGLIPDASGKMEIVLSAYSQASNILFSSFTEQCVIDLLPLQGHAAVIKVTFKNDKIKYSQYSGLKKFLVKRKSRNEFLLTRVDDSVIVSLKKR